MSKTFDILSKTYFN